MKKQIITVVAVALVAVLLAGTYFIFFADDNITEEIDPFYVLSDSMLERLDGLDEKIVITLGGYDPDDSYWVILHTFVQSFDEASKKISVEYEDNGFTGVTVSSEATSIQIEYDSFFKLRYDGKTKYAFDGERLIGSAVCELAGTECPELALRALDGFDIDGDKVAATGAPFVFDPIDRTGISYLSISNSFGEYAIYQQDGQFYFSESMLVGYSDESFASLTTTCRYPVAYGKMELPEGRTYADYGLDSADNATASYTLMTVADSKGVYSLHTVYIGMLASTKTAYYARYIGGIFQQNSDGEDTLLTNLTKDCIYMLESSDIASTLLLPSTDFMTASLVYGITETTQMHSLKDIEIDYYSDGISALVKNMVALNAADNLASNVSSALTSVINNKKFASGYAASWREKGDTFAGFTSSDGKATYINAALAKYSADGNYRVEFGLLRDDNDGARLPAAVTITVSNDGYNYYEIEGGTIAPSQNDKSVSKYSVEFNYDQPVKYVRIGFDVPQTAGSYIVFDEIRIFAGAVDAQPSDSINGVWRLVRPDSFLPQGANFAYLDSNNFNNFIYSVATLEGDRVVACGISENGDPSKLNTEKLALYGLDNPERHVSYTYEGVTTDIYVSAVNEDGNYYVYSVLSGESNGQEVSYCTDVVAEISVETAPWLDWEFTELLDHSLVSMYIYEMSEMKVSFDGDEHVFDVNLEEDNENQTVIYNGTSLDTKSFRYLYQYLLKIYMHDEYVPAEGDSPELYLTVDIKSTTRDIKLEFYRVSASRCYFTVDGGDAKYYALVESINNFRDSVLDYVAGEEIR